MNRNRFGIIRLSDKLRISIFFLPAVFLFICSQGIVYSSLFILSAFLHEISHLFFLHRYGAKIKEVTLYPFGVDIRADTKYLSYRKEIICTLAGSLSNLVFAAVSAFILPLFPSPQLLFFIMCSLFLGILNLIPLSFFDGGKALRLLLYDRLDIDKAFYYHGLLDVVSSLSFLLLSLALIRFSNYNLSVITVIIYASVSTIAGYIKTPCCKP